MKRSTAYLLTGLIGGTIAAFMALQFSSASYVDGDWIPVGNDSFYHARRILDAAIGERGFYQFDDMIHVPEGSWLSWPWAYDYLMAAALSFVLWVRPSTEPMAFLVHVPVLWAFVNIGLFTLIARQIRLAPALTAVATLGVALLPLTQTLHGVGIIDHHFIELTFVLATVLAGLRFFSRGSTLDAVILGIVLGIAPAFHNGMFILQIPVLACAFVLWLRGTSPESTSLYRLAATLLITTLLITLPSEAFRELHFEFWTLSWFHLYVAFASAACLAWFGRFAANRANIGRLALLAATLAVPLLANALTGAAFLAGKLILLETIVEVKSPFERIQAPGGVRWVTSYYSWLIVTAPVLAVVYAVRSWTETEPHKLYFSIFAVFGVLLLLTQYRLHPFGSWVIFIGGMLLVDEARRRLGRSVNEASIVSLLIVAAALQPSLRNVLFLEQPPGMSRDYAITHPLFISMATACAARGGTALSYADDGHYIRYHTDCSVITNNFLMTPLHRKKILEADRLLQMTPQQFRKAAPQVDYVFVRMFEIFRNTADGLRPRSVADIAARNAPLFAALTFTDAIPDGFRLLDELRVRDDRDFAYARLFEVIHDETEE